MSEENLPNLHIQRAKKPRQPEKDDGLPSLTIRRKQKRSQEKPEQRKKYMSPLNIPCQHCGKVNPVEYYSGMDIKAELRSLYCIDCGKRLWGEENWDEDEKEDDFDEPPVLVSSPSSAASTPTYQEPDRYQPAQGQSRFGRDIQTGKYVDVPQASRRQGLYLIGIPGTGKTGLIENLIIQDIKQGYGVGLLDPHGDLINAVLARMDRRVDDVILLDITDYRYPFGLNLFACSDLTNPIEVQKTVDKVMHIFEKLYEVTRTTPLIIQYLRNCTHTLVANPGYTMADVPLLLRNKVCRSKLVANVRDRNVLGFWQDYEDMKPSDQRAEREPILRRLEELLQPLTFNIVGQSTTTIDIRQVMDEGKILLVKLDAQLDSITSLIGSILIALFLNAAYSRAGLQVHKRRQFNLYADEFQRFATEDFATILVEARKYGLATTIAHQARFQPGMTDGIRATSLSAKNLVVFKVNSKDGDDLAGEFDITPQEAWEEEIEPERIKVLRPQRHERIEEQVEVEVEEDILEIPQNPLEYLQGARATHENPAVTKTFRTIIRMSTLWSWRERNYTADMLNSLLVDVMEGKVRISTDVFAARVEDIMRWGLVGWMENSMRETFPGWKTNNDESIERLLSSCIQAAISGSSIFETVSNEYISEKTASRTESDINEWINSVGEDGVLRTPSAKAIAYMRKDYEQHNRKIAVKDVDLIKEYLPDLVALCKGLAEDPIMVPTGKKRMVKRIQPHITYLTHESEKITIPRKTIMHPQRTYADMHNEVASQLTNLDNFMARVRYINAEERLVECTLRTLNPNQSPDSPLFGQALQERKDRIKEQNIKYGYLRERAEVEEEIRQRQEQCSQPPEAEPPISRRPSR